MLSVLAYVEVRIGNVDGRSSFDGQRHRLKAFAQAEDLKIREWFGDSDESSEVEEKEDGTHARLKEAFSLALETGWPILVVDSTRFSQIGAYQHFVAAGGKLYGVNGFGADEAAMRAKIKQAKLEGEERSTKTLKGQMRAKAAGKKFGTPTPQNGAAASAKSRGRDAALRKYDLERLCDEAAASGVTVPKRLADWFNDRGHLTAQGKRWTAANVRKHLGGRLGANEVNKRSKVPEEYRDHPEWGIF